MSTPHGRGLVSRIPQPSSSSGADLYGLSSPPSLQTSAGPSSPTALETFTRAAPAVNNNPTRQSLSSFGHVGLAGQTPARIPSQRTLSNSGGGIPSSSSSSGLPITTTGIPPPLVLPHEIPASQTAPLRRLSSSSSIGCGTPTGSGGGGHHGLSAAAAAAAQQPSHRPPSAPTNSSGGGIPRLDVSTTTLTRPRSGTNVATGYSTGAGAVGPGSLSRPPTPPGRSSGSASNGSRMFGAAMGQHIQHSASASSILATASGNSPTSVHAHLNSAASAGHPFRQSMQGPPSTAAYGGVDAHHHGSSLLAVANSGGGGAAIAATGSVHASASMNSPGQSCGHHEQLKGRGSGFIDTEAYLHLSPRGVLQPITHGTSAVVPGGGGSSSKSNIMVAVRLRPLGEKEKKRGDHVAWAIDAQRNVGSYDRSGTFTAKYHYDTVFGPDSTNEEVFSTIGRPLISSAFSGINGTVFAYGVTSSGKTHTMMGTAAEPGVVPRVMREVFEQAAAACVSAPGRRFSFRLSMLEIYNEVLNDLLQPANANLKLREGGSSIKSSCNLGGVVVDGLAEEVVTSAEHALALVDRGDTYRKVSATAFNEDSSRSHTITRLTVEGYDAPAMDDAGVAGGVGRRTQSTICLIDLAGSESARATQSKDQRMEGGFINKSLLTLGTVIHKLATAGPAGAAAGSTTHVPFRDSKLTRLLQNSLSGAGARIAIVCNITPAAAQSEETSNTLKFATRAKLVRIAVARNEQLDDRALVRRYQRELGELRRQLAVYMAAGATLSTSELSIDDPAGLRQQLLLEQQLRARLEQDMRLMEAQKARLARQVAALQAQLQMQVGLADSATVATAAAGGSSGGRGLSMDSLSSDGRALAAAGPFTDASTPPPREGQAAGESRPSSSQRLRSKGSASGGMSALGYFVLGDDGPRHRGEPSADGMLLRSAHSDVDQQGTPNAGSGAAAAPSSARNSYGGPEGRPPSASHLSSLDAGRLGSTEQMAQWRDWPDPSSAATPSSMAQSACGGDTDSGYEGLDEQMRALQEELGLELAVHDPAMASRLNTGGSSSSSTNYDKDLEIQVLLADREVLQDQVMAVELSNEQLLVELAEAKGEAGKAVEESERMQRMVTEVQGQMSGMQRCMDEKHAMLQNHVLALRQQLVGLGIQPTTTATFDATAAPEAEVSFTSGSLNGGATAAATASGIGGGRSAHEQQLAGKLLKLESKVVAALGKVMSGQQQASAGGVDPAAQHNNMASHQQLLSAVQALSSNGGNSAEVELRRLLADSPALRQQLCSVLAAAGTS